MEEFFTCPFGRVKEIREHIGKKSFDGFEPVEHIYLLYLGEVVNVFRLIHDPRHVYGDVMFASLEIALIEVVESEEGAERHSLEVRRYWTVKPDS